MYSDLIKKYGSPLYVYDQDKIKKSCFELALFRSTLANSIGRNVRIHYSTKTNANPAILKIVKDSKLSVDAMSPFELEVCERSGFAGDDILYVCNNITAEEMKMVHDKGILICLDSISQVETWGENFPGTNIMIRINPGVKGVGHSDKVITSGNATKFGITEENIPELNKAIIKYNLRIKGIHQHLGSLFLDEKIPNYIAGVKAGLEIISKHFKYVQIVDLGGGFGVPYKPDEEPLNLSKVEAELETVLKEFLEETPAVQEFKFEPGRIIPCMGGILVGTVTAVKNENGINWIGTDIGMNQLVRPSMYDAYHGIEIYSDNDEEIIEANIVGNVCESGDILGKNRKVQKPSVGDEVVVYNAGAYGYSMASNYTGRARPAEVMQTKDGDILIRERETLADMLKTIKW